MAAIRMELEAEGNDEISIMTAARMIAERTALGKTDIVDRGVSMSPSTFSRFVLNKDLLYELGFVVGKLQDALKLCSELCEERTGYFKVDPKGVLFKVLKGTNDLGLLNIAWIGLRRRIELSIKTLDKYEAQYQNRQAIISSPTSTASELYNPLERLETASDQMRELFDRVPHFRDQLSESSREKTKTFRNWSQLAPIPDEIFRAFPDRKPERHPPIRFYDEKGRFIEIDYSDLESEENAKSERTPKADVKSGKQREIPPHLTSPENWRVESSLNPPTAVEKRPDAGALLGSGTPFKGTSGMFDNIPFPPNMEIPAREGLPNVLHGLATPASASSNPFYANSASGPTDPGELAGPSWRDRTTTAMTAYQTTPDPSKSAFGTPWNQAQHKAFSTTHAATSTIPPTGSSRNAAGENPDGNNNRERNAESGSSGGGSLPLTLFPRHSRGPGNSGESPGGGGGPPDAGGGGGGGPPYPGGSGPWNHSVGGGGPPNPGGNGPGNYSSFNANGGGGGGNGPPNPGGGGGQWNSPHPNGGWNVPTIKSELKPDDLPSWDGNHRTAVEYFWKVQQLASLGGNIPQSLGQWLWKKLIDNSPVQSWFVTLTHTDQANMRSHYVNFLRGIRDDYLGDSWQLEMNEIYKTQSFRQKGHERESPPTFITRRVMYTRMLVVTDDGGPKEVYEIMKKAPIAWKPILILENIRDTKTLFSKVTTHELALIHAARQQDSSNYLTADNLEGYLRKLGITEKPRNFQTYRRANATEIEKMEGDESAGDSIAPTHWMSPTDPRTTKF
ncbi:hypothetical protein FPV67DRAFT_1681056 [Lyophyllum atratum]|nr:hypothetical protein FPV67DRAFT_1681056 [Lyophyllum atratum]